MVVLEQGDVRFEFAGSARDSVKIAEAVERLRELGVTIRVRTSIDLPEAVRKAH